MYSPLIKLLTRNPLWAILPEAFSTLVSTDVRAWELAAKKSQALNASLVSSSGPEKKAAGKVAVIPIDGVLTKNDDWAGTTYDALQTALTRVATDPNVKHVVLHVDSPGGEVTGLPETASLIASVAKQKPVTAMVDGYAASAAYYLASQANDIVMSPSSSVGSVGVRVMHVDISKALADAGIAVTEMHAGEYKTEFSPFQPLSDAAKADMQTKLDDLRGQFVNAIDRGRGSRISSEMTKAQYGGGRMFTSKNAVTHGLADRIAAPIEFYGSLMAAAQAPTGTHAGTSTQRLRLELAKLRCK